MGMFSWITADTKESISNAHSTKGALPVKMLAPDGRVWREHNYDGYGEFGDKDFFALLDELNSGSGDRDRGIKLYYNGDESVIKPKLVSIYCTTPYEQLDDNMDCQKQGFFYVEDEDDEEEEEYDDDE